MQRVDEFLKNYGIEWSRNKEWTQLSEIIEEKSFVLLEQLINEEETRKNKRRKNQLENFLMEEIFTANGSLKIIELDKLLFKLKLVGEHPEIPKEILNKVKMVFLYPPESFILFEGKLITQKEFEENEKITIFLEELSPGYRLKKIFFPKEIIDEVNLKTFELLTELGRSGIAQLLKKEFIPYLVEEFRQSKKQKRNDFNENI